MTAESAEEIAARVRAINEYHTYAVYSNTCRGLFERHKLLFSFHTTVRILEGDGKISPAEYSFLLRGGLVRDRELQAPNRCRDWLSDASWDHITELDRTIVAFNGLVSSFEQNQREWRRWYEDAEPEEASLPGEWDHKLNELQTMIVLRCLRVDRLRYAMTKFIVSSFGSSGQAYVEPPTLNLLDAFRDSTEKTPLIFVLSPGVDPRAMLDQLVRDRGMESRFMPLALGQGQDGPASTAILDGMANGHWVFLQNAHLMLSWMSELERHVLALEEARPHKDFRLWLSSKPDRSFPIAVLQRSIKMTTEPPQGLKANLNRLLTNVVSESMLEGSSKPAAFKKLLFSLTWFHALLLERRKFKSLGMAVSYDFNDSDFEISAQLLQIYVDMAKGDEVPWDALRYLIAEVNYGGRVTDAMDRRLVAVYIRDVFRVDILTEPMAPLVPSLSLYYVPEDGPLVSYRKYVATLHPVDKPEAFGQHTNAEISSQIADATSMLTTLVDLQPKTTVAGARPREQVVLEIAGEMLERLPVSIQLSQELAEHGANPSRPLETVLLQEVGRYNVLLASVRSQLKALMDGIRGTLVMSSAMDEALDCLFDGRVPASWRSAYPSLKGLGSWTRDLLARVEMMQSWAHGSQPRVFWLTGFTFPTGFLTALLQASARKHEVSIDTLAWEFNVLSVDEAAITEAPAEGAYIRGLFLEGAGWDRAAGTLSEPKAMQLYTEMPIIHFKPVQGKKKLKGIYSCPLYQYPVRAGESLVLLVELRCGNSTSEQWIKRGTALMLSLAV